MENKPDVPNEVLDEEKTADDEAPYRWLKIVNMLFWLFVLSYIGLVIITSIFSGFGNQPTVKISGDWS